MSETERPAPYPATEYAKRHFRAIVDHARATNPFYRRWITDPENVPILPRSVFQEHNDEILNGKEHNEMTSGSTGMPVRVFLSRERVKRNREDSKRFVGWLGGTLPAVYIIQPRSYAQHDYICDVSRPVDEQLAFIAEHREKRHIRAITTYPTNAERLCEEILRLGLDMTWVERFGLYAEASDDGLPLLIRKAFPNAQIWNSYSSVEFGMIAGQCPHEPEFLHVMAHKLGVEVLNDDDAPCREGEMGRVVITDYFNRETPLIRYDIGDLAVLGTCPCGKIPLPSFRKVIGKVYNALVDRDGKRLVFYSLSQQLKKIAGIRQFQAVQRSVEEVVIRVVGPKQVDAAVREVVADYFGYLPHGFAVEHVESIARQPNGKFFAAICEV